MTAAQTESGNWGEQWSAEEVGLLRSVLGLSKASFADRLKIHRRTARRWEQGDTAAIDHRVIAALDDLLCETVCQVACWLTPIQVRQMERRDVLHMLAGGAFVPLGGIDSVSSYDIPRRLDDGMLDHLQLVTTALAQTFNTAPSRLLEDPVIAHLESASRMLEPPMLPLQRERLHSIIADLAAFAGQLTFNAHKPGQASAFCNLAEQHARESGNPVLLAEVLADSSVLYATTSPGERPVSREALERLEQADHLTRKHRAARVVRLTVAARLAEARARHRDKPGADEAFERAQAALSEARADGFTGFGFHSTTGLYAGWDGACLDGFQGLCEGLLGRPAAIDTLSKALTGARAPRWRARIMTDMGRILAAQGHPDESCARLAGAHILCKGHDYGTGIQRIHRVRNQFSKKYAGLSCVQELDELLGWG